MCSTTHKPPRDVTTCPILEKRTVPCLRVPSVVCEHFLNVDPPVCFSICNKGLFGSFITRAASVNYPNVQHQSRECGQARVSQLALVLNFIFDLSIRSIVDHNVQYQSRECGFDAARRTRHSLHSDVSQHVLDRRS